MSGPAAPRRRPADGAGAAGGGGAAGGAGVRRSLAEVGSALEGSSFVRDRQEAGLGPGGARARSAAVLVALFEEGGDARVILTRRAASLRTHSGEVAFPGGVRESGEGPETTALREAREEIGLDPSAVEVAGRLPHIETVSGSSSIVPVLGLLAVRPSLSPNPAEVARVFDVGLAELTGAGVHRSEVWMGPDGKAHDVHFFGVGGETVWGATARILVDLLAVLHGEAGH